MLRVCVSADTLICTLHATRSAQFACAGLLETTFMLEPQRRQSNGMRNVGVTRERAHGMLMRANCCRK